MVGNRSALGGKKDKRVGGVEEKNLSWCRVSGVARNECGQRVLGFISKNCHIQDSTLDFSCFFFIFQMLNELVNFIFKPTFNQNYL